MDKSVPQHAPLEGFPVVDGCLTVGGIPVPLLAERGGGTPFYAAPEVLLQTLEGQVWQWTVPSADLPALKQKYLITGTIRRSDGLQVRVVSPSAPAAGAEAIAPSLEDVYLHEVARAAA